MLARLGRQSLPVLRYGASGRAERALRDALSPGEAPSGLVTEVLSPPGGDGQAADTVLRLKSAAARRGMPVAVLGRRGLHPDRDHPRAAPGSADAVRGGQPRAADRRLVGREYGFTLATTDAERAIAETPAPGLVVVATAHDSHTRLACAALKAGHRVFVEKPPVVTEEDVHRLVAAMRAHPGAVEIGFNRRYHPLVRRARARLRQETGPVSISCLVKELTFEPDHWYFWPNQATRITGNLCHWIDLAVFLIEDQPMPVSRDAVPADARAPSRAATRSGSSRSPSTTGRC